MSSEFQIGDRVRFYIPGAKGDYQHNEGYVVAMSNYNNTPIVIFDDGTYMERSGYNKGHVTDNLGRIVRGYNNSSHYFNIIEPMYLVPEPEDDDII